MPPTTRTSNAPAVPGRRPLPRVGAFGSVAAIFVAFLAASAAPSPLYVVYQQRWGFSSTTLTLIFAVYVVGLLATLLVVGGLSDHVGRRPVLAVAVALETVALVLFAVAGGVGVLLIARVVQGIATGAATATLAAALVDLEPPHAPGRAGVVNAVVPLAGLAVGALGCGALVQYAPAPTRLVYLLLLGGMAGAALVVARMPETSALRSGARASLTPRLGVPPALRAEMLALVPILVASWALGGLYLSLGPSVAARLFGLESHLVGGLVVSLLCATGAAMAFALRARPAPSVLAPGAAGLAAGTAVSLAGVHAGSAVVAAIGVVVSGVGFGAASLGCFGTLARMAGPRERGEVLAVAYVVAYLAFSIPAVAAGFAATTAGLYDTTEVYAAVVIVLALAALAGQQLLAVRRGPAIVSGPG